MTQVAESLLLSARDLLCQARAQDGVALVGPRGRDWLDDVCRWLATYEQVGEHRAICEVMHGHEA